MIKKLSAAEKGKTAAFLYKENYINTYLEGYINRFGFDRNFCEVFGEGEKSLGAVLLRFYNSFYIYTDFAKADYEEISVFLNMQNNITDINGGKSSIMPLVERIKHSGYKESCFSALNEFTEDIDNSDVVEAESVDIKEVYNLLSKYFHLPAYDEFYSSWFYRRRDGGGKTYIIRFGAIIASTASVIVKADKSAIIGAVATNPKFRGRGYAKSVVFTAAKDVKDSGLTPCIAYNNPIAGKIYKKLGFRQTGTIVTLNIY